MTDPSKTTPSALEQAFRVGHASGFSAGSNTSRSQASHVEDAWEEYRDTNLSSPSGSDLNAGALPDNGIVALANKFEGCDPSGTATISIADLRAAAMAVCRVQLSALRSTPSSTLTPDGDHD